MTEQEEMNDLMRRQAEAIAERFGITQRPRPMTEQEEMDDLKRRHAEEMVRR